MNWIRWKIGIISLLSIVVLNNCVGQTKPIFFPDQINNAQGIHTECFCKSGVNNQSRSRGMEWSYLFQNRRRYKSTDEFQFTDPFTEIDLSIDWEFKVKIPVLNRDDVKLLVGYNHNEETYRLSQVGIDYSDVFQEFSQTRFKSNQLSTYFLKFYADQYFIASFKWSSNGNYNNFFSFDKRFDFFNIAAIWARKVTPDFEWGVGFRYGKRLDNRHQLIPFVLLNRNFSDKWGVEAVLPAFVFFRNNINPNTNVLYGAELAGQSYVFQLPSTTFDTPSYIFDHSKVQLKVSLEQKIVDWVWLNIEAGYHLTFYSGFESENLSSFEVEPENHPFAKIGVFLSPPDKFLK